MRPWVVVTIVGGLAIFGAWLLTPWTIRLISQRADDSLSNLGPVGDTFGATSALFNGLAFLGLVVVLVYEMEERKRDLGNLQQTIKLQNRAMRPFLVPQITRPSAARVTRAEWENGDLVVEVSVSVEVANPTNDIALNAVVTTQLSPDSGNTWVQGDQASVGLPIGSSDNREITCAFAVRGDQARLVLATVANHGSLALSTRLEYEALNALKWASTAKYSLTLEGEGPEQASHILKKSVEYYVDRRTPAGLPFESRVDATSWRHEEVD